MQTDEAQYSLIFNAFGATKRPNAKPVRFRYRIWMGKGLEPVCLVVLGHMKDVSPANRFAIQRSVVEKISSRFPARVRYFECVINSRRLVTEVYFSRPGVPLVVPRGELRSLAYLEKILGQTVNVV